MSHLEQHTRQSDDKETLQFFIATVTTEGKRMTITKSSNPFRHDLVNYSLFLVGSLLTLALMNAVFNKSISLMHLMGMMPTLLPLGGMLAVAFLIKNYQGIFDLFSNPDATVIDKANGTVYWNGQYACQLTDIEAIRVWVRVANEITRFRVSLMLQGNRAFHLVETPQFDVAEQYQRSLFRRPTFSFSFFGIYPELKWEPCPIASTESDGGKYDQFAFARVLAKFLNVPIL